ncbi:MAG: hypothetical protein ACP5IT_12235, partial [Thermoproteota archaeon]
FVSYPYVWWIPGLGILEEFVHLLVGYGKLPSYDTFFHHWSVGLLGFNIYPWITFPLITIAGELAYRKVYRPKFVKLMHAVEKQNKFVKKKAT